MQQVESPNTIVVAGGDNVREENNQEENEDGFGSLYVGGLYQPKAHFALEKRRFERDLTIQTIVDGLGEDVCDFIEVSSKKSGVVTVLTYHPNPEVKLPPTLRWVDKPALYVRNGGRFYKEASNEKIEWNYKALSGEIFDLIEREFTQDFMYGNYKNAEKEKFCRKAANFIIHHPHENAKVYGVYLKYFKDMILALDDSMDDDIIELLMIAIAMEMKRVADFKDKDLPQKTLYFKIVDISTKMTVQQCSKAVHYRLDKIDKDAQNARTDLIELSIRAEKLREARRVEAAEKMNEMKARMANAVKSRALPVAATKRKIEEISNGEDSAEQPPAKQQRIEDVTEQVTQELKE